MSIFFTLSAYLLCRSYWPKFKAIEADNHVRYGRFLKHYFLRRFLRLWPVFLLLLGFGWAQGGNFAWQHLFFMQGPIKQQMPQVWSVGVECVFYCFLPLYFWILKRYNYPVLVILNLLFMAAAWWVLCPEKSMDKSILWAVYSYFGRAPEFLIGMGAALYVESLERYRFERFEYWLVFLFALIVLYLSYCNEGSYGAYTSVGFGVHGLLLPCCVAAFLVACESSKSLLNNLLSSTLFQFFGRISYSLFLLHYGFLAMLLFNMLEQNILLFCVSAFALSALAHFALESFVAWVVATVFKIRRSR